MAGLAGPSAPERGGWAAGLPILFLVLVLTLPSGLPATGATALFMVLGSLAVLLGRRLWAAAFPPGPSGVVLGRVVNGLASGAVPAVAWTAAGGPGWAARIAVWLGVGLWTAGAELAASGERVRAVGSALAFLALLAFTGLGYVLLAGLLYYMAPPLALVCVLAGQFAANFGAGRGETGADRPGDEAAPWWCLTLDTAGYVVAALTMAVLAWVDLG